MMSYTKPSVVIAGVALALFVFTRVSGVGLPYHQDEAKLGIVAHEQAAGDLLKAHPPLTEALWVGAGKFIDSENLRVVPVLFSVISIVLLYMIVRRRVGARAALFSVILYVVCAYSVLASLMLDTDGAVLPALFLAVVYSYDRAQEALTGCWRLLWGSVCATLLVIGLLVKLSFVLVLAALALEMLLAAKGKLSSSATRLGIALLVAAGLCAAVAIYAADVLSSAVDFSSTWAHALSYLRFEDRGYFQIAIQSAKALMYLSPLLLVPLLFVYRDTVRACRIFVCYLAVGAVFYLVLFDFSTGALDKYLMFSIVPLVAIGGAAYTSIFDRAGSRELMLGVSIGAVASLMLLALNFLPHEIVPQYPKDAWVAHIARMHWNILFPFTGGSGPLGFYISLLFMVATFAVSGILALIGRMYERFQAVAVVSIAVIGLIYSFVLTEEMLFGKINGSAPEVLRSAIEHVSSTGGGVITHADAGNYELRLLNAYSGRFYAVPGYESAHKDLFAQHRGRYLVVDMPPLNPQMFYSRFFATCTEEFTAVSGRVQSHVYYCPNSDPHSID